MNNDKKEKIKIKRDKDEDVKYGNNFEEDYSYDFIPTLNEWVNIDEQKAKAKELEDI